MTRFSISFIFLFLTLFATILAGQSARIMVSPDNGVSWKASDQGFPADGIVNCFERHGQLLFAGTEAHGLFRSADEGKQWQKTGFGLPDKIKSLVSFEDLLFAGTFRQGVKVSYDKGQTWFATGDLPSGSVRDLIVFRDALFAAADNGIFISKDKGNSWQQLASGFQANRLAINDAQLFAATHKGIVRSDDNGKTWQWVYAETGIYELTIAQEKLYALSFTDGVLSSVDGGANWINVSSNLPSKYDHYTLEIVEDNYLLVAGQDAKIFRSNSGGLVWQKMSESLQGHNSIKSFFQSSPRTILAGAGR